MVWPRLRLPRLCGTGTQFLTLHRLSCIFDDLLDTIRGNDSGRHYVARIVETYPDTREIKVHYFCHQMSRSKGSRSTPIYDDMLPLSKRILSPEYIYFVKSTNQERRVGTFNPKLNYQPMTDTVKLGKDQYDHALILRGVQLNDNNQISQVQIDKLADLAPEAI